MIGKDVNKSELCQNCLKALQDLKVSVDPSTPYYLQLVEWALENLTLEGPWKVYQEDLLDQVGAMYGWKKRDPEGLFWNHEDENPPYQTNPEALALELLENLYENLREMQP